MLKPHGLGDPGHDLLMLGIDVGVQQTKGHRFDARPAKLAQLLEDSIVVYGAKNLAVGAEPLVDLDDPRG